MSTLNFSLIIIIEWDSSEIQNQNIFDWILSTIV